MKGALKWYSQVMVIVAMAFVGTIATYFFHPRRPALYLQGQVKAPAGQSLDRILADGENIVWIDVRSDQAFARGHIPEAISLNVGNVDQQMVTHQHLFSQKNHFVVYGDRDSTDAIERTRSMLQGMGYPKVTILEGGWEAWQNR